MATTKLCPYLNFNGNTREAMEFYQKVLGGKLQVMKFSEAKGMPVPPDYEDKVLHAHLECDGFEIMASESQPGTRVTFGDNFSINLQGNDAARLTDAFKKLAEGGKIHMPLAKQFWGATFGSLTDRFGVNWMVNIEG